jgi:predicted RNase H-like HicB family nuclease
MNANVVVEKDGEGYLACVKGSDNLFAYGLTREQALDELSSVIEMTKEYNVKSDDFRKLS